MRDKRGFLLATETLKIVIAVICIGFLVYFLVSLYFANINKEKTKEAEATLISSVESIRVKIEGLENMNSTEHHLPNPSGWYLFNFVEEKKPNSCIGKKCLCICGKVWVDIFDGQIKECDKDGVCLIVGNLKSFDIIKIKKGGTFVLISKIDDMIGIKESDEEK